MSAAKTKPSGARYCRAQLACDGVAIPRGAHDDCGRCREAAARRARPVALRGAAVKLSASERGGGAMTAAERLLIEAEADAAEAKARRLREGLRQPGEPTSARPKQKRGPALPKAPTEEERAKVASSLDEAAWDRYVARRGIRRSA